MDEDVVSPLGDSEDPSEEKDIDPDMLEDTFDDVDPL